MTTFGTLLAFLRSRTLTVWLVGLFVLYYLTTAVWVGEAFGRYMNHLSANNLFRAFYLLFLANAVLRVADAAAASFPVRRVFLLRLPLYAGTVLFLCALFLSLNFRQAIWLPPAGIGDRLSVPWERDVYEVVSVAPALKKRALRTDNAVIFDFEPGLTVRDGKGAVHVIGAFPPSRVASTYFHVLQFGIAPGVELRQSGKVLVRGNVALRLTPFGVVDTFDLPPHPYQFSIAVAPNRTIKKGKELARDYDLDRPRYLVEVIRNGNTVVKGETEDAVFLDGTLSLSFFKPDDWVIVEAVHDPFLFWLASGTVLLILGGLLYPLSGYSRGDGGGNAEAGGL